MEKHLIPEKLNEYIRREHPTEHIVVALSSDITRSGDYGLVWLVATPQRIVTAEMNGAEAVILSATALADIESVGTVDLVGNGALQITIRGTAQPIVYFSNAKKPDFCETVTVINLLRAGTAVAADQVRSKRVICAKCSLPVPEEMSSCPRCADKRALFLRVFRFIRPQVKFLCLTLLILMGTVCIGLAVPYMSKYFIDTVLKPDASGVFTNGHLLALGVGMLFLCYAGQLLLEGLERRASGVLGFRAVHTVRTELYAKLQELSLSYFDKNQVGGLLSRVNQDTEDLKSFLVDFIPWTVNSVLTVIGVGTLLFILNPTLTLIVLIPVGIAVVGFRLAGMRMRSIVHRYFHIRGKLTALAGDSLSGMRIIKTFGKEAYEADRFDATSNRLSTMGIALHNRMTMMFPPIQMVVMSGVVAVWAFGGHQVLHGKMTLGSVVAYAGYLGMFYRPVFMFSHMTQLITNSLNAAHRIFDVLDREPAIQNASDAVPMKTVRGEIEFRDVVFGYRKHSPVIKGISLKIAANERIGLVGKSGVGKSTIINLICRLYDANEGQVLIDGVDVRKANYEDLRSNIGMVLQDTFLFNGTIYDNIAYAKSDATVHDIIEAAKAARAHEFIIKKPDGYETEVGEKGGNLSGGEKQRITIARAILRNPRILVLDEATSSVDLETEKKIQEALDTLTKNRTTIAIAHRLSTLRNCDRLFVIEDGKIIETGTHEELLAKQGVFHKLVNIQQEISRIISVEG